jgi:hypothetical protein
LNSVYFFGIPIYIVFAAVLISLAVYVLLRVITMLRLKNAGLKRETPPKGHPEQQ